MAKNNNKGFSLVEVIIAVAVFAILIVPITSQLISSMNINSTSTTKQYAIDKAEEVMESFKTISLGSSTNDVVSISDGNSSTNYDFTLSNITQKTQTINGTDGTETVTYNVQTYTCNNITYGEALEKYSCSVEVSDLAYQVMALGYIWDADKQDVKTENGVPVTTSSAVGTVRNLDNSQVAVIAGATYKSGATDNNLDMEAYEYLLIKKVSLLQSYYTLEYYQYMNGYGVLDDGMFEKNTTINIDYDEVSNVYTVSCTVSYTDSSGFRLDNYYVNGTNNVYDAGTVYSQEYSELPPIYLLYTPATYNGKYVETDNIYVKTSNLKADDQVVLYVFETTTDMSESYKEIIESELGVSSVDDLIYSSSRYEGSYTDVVTHLEYKDEPSKSSNVIAYSNFSISTNDQSLLNIACQDTSADVSDEVYYYDLVVTLEDSDGNTTKITGTRGN